MSKIKSHRRRLKHTLFAALLLVPTVSRAEALIGRTREVTVVIAAPADLDARAAFARPETIPFPSDNLYTPEKARLGRSLYFDPRLSRSGVQACASCHNPALAYGDGLARGMGNGMKSLARRTPTIFNAAWSDALMWDGRYETLEAQAIEPIQSPAEMNMPVAEVAERLGALPAYRKMFDAAFPGRAIDGDAIARAIATYERTIVSDVSPFDAWVSGDETAILEPAKRGFALFTGKAHCADCHNGWALSDNGFHDIGLAGDDIGRGMYFPQIVKMQHAFKTPSLREIDRRAPYMHDGSLPTLEAVVAHYDAGGLARPSRSELVQPIGLTDVERSDLVAFLRTLSSRIPAATMPTLPR